MKWKRYLFFFVAAVLAAGLAAVVFRKAEKSKDRDGAVIEVWAWDETFNIKALHLAAEKYGEKHPEVKIKIVLKEKNEIMQKLTNDFSAEVYENLPDIALIEDYEVQKLLWEHEDEFLVLDDVMDYRLYQDYKAELVSKGGIHYGVPFDSGAAVMFYRKDYIEAAGYTEEDMQNITWEEYIELGHRVKAATGARMLTVQPDDLGLIRIMMQSAGSWYMTRDGKNADIEHNSALREAIRIYKKLVEEDLALSVSGWDGFTDAFHEGEVATVVSGCWIASSVKEKQEQSGNWRVAQIPRMEEVEGACNASNIGGSSWYVLKNREHCKKAADFLKETFGEDEEFINLLAEEINLVTTRKNAEKLTSYHKKDEFFGNTNILQVFLEATENVPVVNYGGRTYEIEGFLEGDMQEILTGKDLDEALKNVQVKAQSIVK